ncbi:MAG: helix-turn-helix transcriptional regulator [Victivallaceae bacterium]
MQHLGLLVLESVLDNVYGIIMEQDCNNWNLLKRWLSRNSMSQNKLAELLAISSSAVSQIKHGKLNLSPEQISRIIALLNPPEPEIENYYSTVFNRRFATGRNEFKVAYNRNRSGGGTSVPLLNLNQLQEFEPALMSFMQFAELKGGKCEGLHFNNEQSPLVALKISGDDVERFRLNSRCVNHETLILINASVRLTNNCPVIARINGGEIIVGSYSYERGVVSISDFNVPFFWVPRREPGRISWMFAVEK